MPCVRRLAVVELTGEGEYELTAFFLMWCSMLRPNGQALAILHQVVVKRNQCIVLMVWGQRFCRLCCMFQWGCFDGAACL